jgi:hypothetical protein
MDQPNPALLEAFGTDSIWRKNLEKTATPPWMQAAAPMTYMGLLQMEQAREHQQMLEAQLMNEMFRQAEAQHMAPVQAGFRGGGPMLSDEGNAAQQMRQMMAYQAMMGKLSSASMAAMRMELEKEAGLGGQLAGKVVGGIGKLFGQTGRRLAGTATQRAVGTAGPMSGLGMRMRQAGVNMQQRAQQWTRHGMGNTARFQQAAAKQGVTAPRMPGQGGPYRTPAPRAAAGAAAATAPAAAAPGKTLMQRLKPGWKTKATLAAGTLGAGYAGYKGLQAAKDYMMAPTYTSQAWGGYGMSPQGDLNQFGYQNQVY